MANTMVELERLSTDVLKKGIMKTIIYNSPLIPYLPFITVTGNSYLFNQETAEAAADWYTVGDTWAEGTPTWAQRNVALKVLGGDADTDAFIQQTRKDQDVEAAIIELKAKAIAYKFDLDSIMGGTTVQVDTKAMQGLMLLLAGCENATATRNTDWDAPNNAQIIDAGPTAGTSATLTIAKLDELIDAVKVKPVDYLLMSKAMRRKVNSLARSSGSSGVSVLTETHAQFGKFIDYYNGIPIIVSDRVPDNIQDGNGSGVVTLTSYDQTTTRGTGYDNGVIFAMHFGEDGLCGVQNAGIQTEDIGKLETKDARRTRIKWYVNMELFNIKALAGLINVTWD